MRRIIIAILVSASLSASSGVQAQESGTEAVAGLNPDSFLYFFDILAEEIWGSIGVFGNNAKAEYLVSRIRERESEAKMMARSRGVFSDEALNVLDRKSAYRRRSAELFLADSNYEKIHELQADGFLFDDEYYKLIDIEKGRVSENIDYFSGEIRKARDSRDNSKLSYSIGALEKAKKEFDDIRDRESKFVLTGEVAAQKFEDTMTGAEKAKLLFERLEWEGKNRRAASDAVWNNLLKQLDATKKAVDAGDENIDLLTRKLQDEALLVRGEIKFEIEDDKEAKDREIERVVAGEAKQPEVVAARAPNPVLKKIPSETISQYPLGLMGWNYMFQATAGEYFETEFDAMGGLAPYYFKLDTASGFPPIGLIISPNGLLSGTPKVSGTYTFKVCVVDTAGKSDCRSNTMYVKNDATQGAVVNPALEPVPLPNPNVEVKISISNKSCSVIQAYSDYTRYIKDVTGSASGPEGAKLKLTYTPLPISCGSWTATDVGSRGNSCARMAGDPETTNWSFRNPNAANTWTGDTLVVESGNKYESTGEIKCP